MLGLAGESEEGFGVFVVHTLANAQVAYRPNTSAYFVRHQSLDLVVELGLEVTRFRWAIGPRASFSLS